MRLLTRTALLPGATRERLARAALVALLCAAAGCSPDQVLGSRELPPDVPDPGQTKTPEGALAAYRGALVQFRIAFGGYGAPSRSAVVMSGLIADELQSGAIGAVGTPENSMPVDSRYLPEFASPRAEVNVPYPATYQELQKVRGEAREARGLLFGYAPDASRALPAALYALEAYADVFLADLFCSGVPMSMIEFEGDYVLRQGASTEEVYAQAVTLFDSAFALATDSAAVVHLARVGKGRALLALGDYTAAAQAVAEVPDDFVYAIQYDAGHSQDWNFGRSFQTRGIGYPELTSTEREGGNGLDFASSDDPRITIVGVGTNKYGAPMSRPAKYSLDGDTPIVLASGVEARLIEAEAQLQANDPHWLTTLNALRTDGTYDTQPDPADSTQTDTLWHAGTGGVAGLRPLEDPGTTDSRVDLLFRERAFWLFLTAHRQGDLRRLIREYGRAANAVYPTGAYPGANGSYGTSVTLPVPAAERAYNPKFTGCQNRGA